MSAIVPGTTTYCGYASYGATMPTYGASYGTAMPTYGTAMPTYGASYGATPMYGGYGGGYGGAHPMDVATVETQKADAMNVLSTQFGVQEKMLNHQHETQLKVLEAEKTRMVAQMTTQYDQQYAAQSARSGEDPHGRADDDS